MRTTDGRDSAMAHGGAGAATEVTAKTSTAKNSPIELMKKGDTKGAYELLQKQPSLAIISDELGFTPLFWARRLGLKALVLNLESYPFLAADLVTATGAPIRGDYKWSTGEGMALILGIINRDEPDALRVVLSTGDWPGNLLPAKGSLVLASLMAKLGRLSLLKLLLEKCPDQIAAGASLKKNNSTPLIEAARAGDAATLKCLLEMGADKSFKNAAGETADSVAKTPEILDLLETCTSGSAYHTSAG